LEQLAALMEISPITLLAYAYVDQDQTADELLAVVKTELRALGKWVATLA
jgi:hypothetical protein